MNDEMERDDRLAALTDAMRGAGGLDVAGEADMEEDLAMVVRGLHQLIPPNQDAPPAFRAALARRLATEFEAQQRHKQPIPLFKQTWVRVASVAAAMIVVVGVIVVLQDSGAATEGTASGSDDVLVVLLGGLFVAMVGLLAAYYYVRRPRS